MALRRIDTAAHIAAGVLVGGSAGLVGGCVLWLLPLSLLPFELPLLGYAAFGALAGAAAGAVFGLIVALTRRP